MKRIVLGVEKYDAGTVKLLSIKPNADRKKIETACNGYNFQLQCNKM